MGDGEGGGEREAKNSEMYLSWEQDEKRTAVTGMIAQTNGRRKVSQIKA